MLQYDNVAFYFFAISTLSFYLVPSWYSIISRVYSVLASKDETIGAVTRTSAEAKKAAALKKESRGLHKLWEKNALFTWNLAFTVCMTALFCWLLYAVLTGDGGEVNTFDPFDILEIDTNADSKAIKRAYRTLSLKYHPDKNPNNRAAEAKFMMVSKAYEALTDETAKENWIKFGNPDGKQSLEVSIGLPSFLLDTQNRNLVLIAYLVVMVGVVPLCVYTYYSDSSKYGEKDVMYDTYSWYHYTLGEHTVMKQLPEILAGSAEFRHRNTPSSPQEREQIGQWTASVRSQMPKPKYSHPVCLKGNVLLMTHLLRKTDILDAKGHDDLKYMLRQSSSLLEAMISVCKYQNALQTAVHCIEFGQYVTQAMWVKDSPLLQLPHFGSEEVKHTQTGKSKVSSVQQYRALQPEQRKGMANFTEEQKRDVTEYLNLFPDITVETKVFVDDDEDDRVYEGDLCTIQIIITRNNLAAGQKVGMVHAPSFPFPKREAWWIVLGQIKEGKILSIDNCTDPTDRIVHDIKFLAPAAGQYEFDLLVKSNAYVGVDHKTKIEMTTLDNSTLPEYKVHPDDAELDDEPTLFEEMLNQHIEQDSDDEDSDDEDDDDAPGAAAAAVLESKSSKDDPSNKKRQQLKARRQANDDDDDDDDSDAAEEVYADK